MPGVNRVIRLDAIVRDRLPVWDRMPSMLRGGVLAVLRQLTRLNDIEALLIAHKDARGAAFIDAFFKALDFSCSVSSGDKARIPATGRLIVVANHPLGAMDALALLRTILDVRPDVRVVVNQTLTQVGSLAENFLPFDMFSARPRKSQLAAIEQALREEAALLIFPAADVSRRTTAGLRDRSWLPGAVRLACKHRAPLLPVFIGGRNSRTFYVVSFFSRTLEVLLLPRQIFYQRGKTVSLTIGNLIPATDPAPPATIDWLRQRVYELAGKS
jgi:putative hemolysin